MGPDASPAGRSAKDETIDHVGELTKIPAFLGDVGVRRVRFHHAVSEPPRTGAFRVQPNDVLGLVVDVPKAQGLGIVVVIAGVAEDDDRGFVVDC